MRYKPAQMTKEQKKEMFEAAFRQLMICDAFMALADFASKIEAQAKGAYRMMKGENWWTPSTCTAQLAAQDFGLTAKPGAFSRATALKKCRRSNAIAASRITSSRRAR